MIVTEEEKKVTAIHEAGHALLGMLLPHADPIHKVTIIPRGMALGLTQQLPIDEKHNYSKNYLNDNIGILLGGRIAEELTTGNITTGAGNDLERATDLARKMVCEWGMSDAMGPLTFGKKEEQIFLGREIAQHSGLQRRHRAQDRRRGQALHRRPVQRSTALLTKHKKRLLDIADALLAREVLDADQVAGWPTANRSTTRRRRDAAGRRGRSGEGEGASVDRSADGADPEAADAGVIAAPRRSFSVPLPGRAPLELGPRTLVMGVLNVTPDSFSDGGLAFDPARALDLALAMEAAGADLIDIGAESTRPGADAGGGARGVARVAARCCEASAPRIRVPDLDRHLQGRGGAAALDEGAADRQRHQRPGYDAGLGPLVAARGVPAVLMHTRGRSGRHVRARRLRRRGRRGRARAAARRGARGQATACRGTG